MKRKVLFGQNYYYYQMWAQQQNGQSLTWKYGKITIVNSSYISIPDVLHITCRAFQAENQSFLSLQLNSEQQKSMRNVEKILDFLHRKNTIRNSQIVIKGGGLLLDIGGFACSIYMRGLENVTYIPTTLLAMVDATVGGKTAINFGQAKNIIGTIKHPKNVIIDMNTLNSLPDREFNNGLAEVIKMAATYDSQFFEFLEGVDYKNIRKEENRQILKKIIKRSLQIKISVVQKDPQEKHQRKWLNFGHTIGHGIQLSSGHNLLHGQCVSIGMIAVLEAAQYILGENHQESISRLKKILRTAGLPIQIPQTINYSEMIELMLKDKKKTQKNDVIDFVLIEKIGTAKKDVAKISKQSLKDYFSESLEIGSFEKINKFTNSQFIFPSSKSISLRFAYISALSYLKFNKNTIVTNFLQSDDTKWMLYSLKQLGFQLNHDQQKRELQIIGYKNTHQATLNIGNSGVTARIILPLCASLKGKWTIQCLPRMSQRPNKEIFKLCQQNFQCSFIFLKNQLSFPCIINVPQQNLGIKNESIKIDGTESSQFITSIMIYGAFFSNQLCIKTAKGTLVSQSYLEMTAKCLQYLSIKTQFKDGQIIINSNKIQKRTQFIVEVDLSSLSYPYIFSKIHNIDPPSLPQHSMQGDEAFYRYINSLQNTTQQQRRLDFNNCTDTFMTMAVFIVSDIIQSSVIQSITLYNIANQRVKQSNRIHLIIKNLQKVGIRIEQYGNQIKIFKRYRITQRQKIIFQTANDHRLAMSLSILSTFLKQKHPQKSFIIDDKNAVNKTFPTFWKYLKLAGITTKPYFKSNYLEEKSYNIQNIVLIGDRGSGKTTLGKHLAQKRGLIFIDLDEKITEQIQMIGYKSIDDLIKKQGWKRFREIQSHTLQQFLISKRPNKFIIATGAGIIESNINTETLKRDSSLKVYLERQFSDLRIQVTSHRPIIDNYREVSSKRAKIYESVANLVVNIPSRMKVDQQISVVEDSIDKFDSNVPLKHGMILCLNNFPNKLEELNINPEDLSSVQLRLDTLLQNKMPLKELRQKIASFQYRNKIDTILTLRSKEQLGDWTGNYLQYQDYIRKIPTNFLDHELKYPLLYPYQSSKMILSYHGQKSSQISTLVKLQGFQGIKKLCFRGSMTDWQNYNQRLGPNSICINLDEPISRLKNNYQFVIPKESVNNRTGIMTVQQMKILNLLKKSLIRR